MDARDPLLPRSEDDSPRQDQAPPTSDQARKVAEEASRKLAEVTRQVRQYGEAAARQQKERAAAELSRFGGTIRQTAQRLDRDQDKTIASYVGAAAETLEDAANYLQRCDLPGMLHDAQRVAKQRPELVIGGMFVAGVALARFLKASQSDTAGLGNTDDVYVPTRYREDEIPTPQSAPTQNSGPSLAHRGLEAVGGSPGSSTFNPGSGRMGRFDNEENL